MLAYVLIQVAVGMAPKVLADIEKVEGVVDALIVTGPYDIMLKVNAKDVDELGKLIVSGIQSVQGIVRTLTCPVVQL